MYKLSLVAVIIIIGTIFIVSIIASTSAVDVKDEALLNSNESNTSYIDNITEETISQTVSIEEHVSAPVTSAETSDTEEPVEDAWIPDNADAELIAKILYRECRGVKSDAEKAAVVWCILNRVDSLIAYFPDTIQEVAKQPHQFAYIEDTPVESDLYNLAVDVLIRWHNEKSGQTNVGRTLPIEYVYFIGDGQHNHFSIEWKSRVYWNWSLDNPYEV